MVFRALLFWQLLAGTNSRHSNKRIQIMGSLLVPSMSSYSEKSIILIHWLIHHSVNYIGKHIGNNRSTRFETQRSEINLPPLDIPQTMHCWGTFILLRVHGLRDLVIGRTGPIREYELKNFYPPVWLISDNRKTGVRRTSPTDTRTLPYQFSLSRQPERFISPVGLLL